MPELPDVETFKRVLEKNGLRKTIGNVVVSDRRIIGKLAAATFIGRLQGTKLVAARRHGKHLLASIDRGGWLALHFRREVRSRTAIHARAPRIRNDGSLAYTNKRMIGHLGWVEDAADFIATERLGPDALDRRFDLAAFKARMLGTKRDVKSALMDQQIIAGIGNIFSDEILFQARINPGTDTEPAQAAIPAHARGS